MNIGGRFGHRVASRSVDGQSVHLGSKVWFLVVLLSGLAAGMITAQNIALEWTET